MPTTLDGVEIFLDARILYAPGKAANAGGVATSGLEMAQNSMRYAGRARRSTPAARDHEGDPPGVRRDRRAFGTPGNYVHGANIAGFLKVADAMMDQGLV
jgi:glutamate dehydrogenase (NADP+)